MFSAFKIHGARHPGEARHNAGSQVRTDPEPMKFIPPVLYPRLPHQDHDRERMVMYTHSIADTTTRTPNQDNRESEIIITQPDLQGNPQVPR